MGAVLKASHVIRLTFSPGLAPLSLTHFRLQVHISSVFNLCARRWRIPDPLSGSSD
jgi:hypothetical protein